MNRFLNKVANLFSRSTKSADRCPAQGLKVQTQIKAGRHDHSKDRKGDR